MVRAVSEVQVTAVVSLAPRQIDRGDVEWHSWDDTEAGKYRSCSCERKRKATALFLAYSIAYFLVKVDTMKISG